MFIFPIPAKGSRKPTISDGFKPVATTENRYHPGVDIDFKSVAGDPTELPWATKNYMMFQNWPVLATAPGKVVTSTQFSTGGGIGIDHGDGLRSNYIHLSRRDASVGDTVKAGQQIGIVGYNTAPGAYKFAHLHFEMLKDGRYVDPAPFLTGAVYVQHSRLLSLFLIALVGYVGYKFFTNKRG